MTILGVLGLNPRHQRLEDNRLAENSGLDSSTFQARKPSPLLRMHLSGCKSSPAISSPPSMYECHAPQPMLVSSAGIMTTTRRGMDLYVSNSHSDLSDLAHSQGRAKTSNKPFPTCSKWVNGNPALQHNGPVADHPNQTPISVISPATRKSSLACSAGAFSNVECVETTPPRHLASIVTSKKAGVASAVAQQASLIDFHREQNVPKQSATLLPLSQGQICDHDCNGGGSETLLPGKLYLKKSSAEALMINERDPKNHILARSQTVSSRSSQIFSASRSSRSSFSSRSLTPTPSIEGRKVSLDLPREPLTITHWQENALPGCNTTRRLQSSQTKYGHYVAPNGGISRQSSHSLHSLHHSHSLIVRRHPSKFQSSEKLYHLPSRRERRIPAPARHGTTPFSHSLSSQSNPSLNERKLIPVLTKVPSDTGSAKPLPRSGPSQPRQALDEVRPTETRSQSIPRRECPCPVTQQAKSGAQSPKKLEFPSLSKSQSSVLSIRDPREGNFNRCINSQKRYNCEADLEIISDILQIMAVHGESISKSPISIEFSIEKTLSIKRSAPEKSFEQSAESEAPKMKPSSIGTLKLRPSKRSSPEHANGKPRQSHQRSASSFSLGKLGMEARLTKTSHFVRPSESDAGSVIGIHTHRRNRSEYAKIRPYPDPNDDDEHDPSRSKTDRFEALLKASDASNGGTIKMSLSSKMDSLDQPDHPTPLALHPCLNLNLDSFSPSHNWFGGFSAARLDKTGPEPSKA